jgi:hypothetical protein
VNARELYSRILVVLLSVGVSAASAQSARQMLREGNKLFSEGKHTEAINKYNEALVEQPEALEPKFNKADSYYRLDDLGEAIDLYQEVAAESKAMPLVTKAKYNLGNCFFQRGSKQRDSDLQKALEDMKAAVAQWRQVLDIEPENAKAARNIEVARLTIKDILDQLKRQQEQQKQQQQQQNQQDQQDQQSQQDQQQQQQGQGQQKDQSQSQQDPNQPQDPNQTQDAGKPQEPNQPQDEEKEPDKQQQGQPQEQDQQQTIVPDATAQEILDKEQRQKEQRRILQRGQTQKVEKDW